MGMYESKFNQCINHAEDLKKTQFDFFFFSDTPVPTSADSSADSQSLQPLAVTGHASIWPYTTSKRETHTVASVACE